MANQDLSKKVMELVESLGKLTENIEKEIKCRQNLEELLRYWKKKYPGYKVDVLSLPHSYALRFVKVHIDIPEEDLENLSLEELIKKYTPNLD
ncbi:MAG: hypothetical protein QXI41_02145 [Candidatus Pacearchaeota archaeon]